MKRTSGFLLALLVALALIANTSKSTAAFQSVPPTTQNRVANVKSLIESAEMQKESTLLQIEKNNKALLEAETELEALKAKMEKDGISGESYTDVISLLQSSKVQLLIDLAGLDAKKKTINTLQKNQNTSAGAAAEMLEQLERMYQLQEENMDELKKLAASKAISQQAIRDAEMRLIELRIRMIQEKQQVTGNPQLVEQLIQISIEQAEKKARLEQVEIMLSQFIESRDTLTSKNRLQQQINVFKGNNDVANARLKNIERQIHAYQQQLSELENDN